MGGITQEIRIAIHAIWVRRWLALAVAWCVCLGGWLVVSQIPNKYESHARVSVTIQNMMADQGGLSAADQQKSLNQVQQTLVSAVNLEKVVRGTDLGATVQNDRDVADRVAALSNAIKISEDQDNLFTISATLASGAFSDAGNAKLARDVVQKLIDIFVEGNLTDDKQDMQSQLKFYDDQINDRQKQLQDLDNQRQQFQANYLGSLPGTGSLDDRMSAARSAIAQIDGDLAAAQSSLSMVNGQLAGTPATIAGGGTSGMGPARARLSAILGQIADARAKGYTDQHPDMIALRAQLGAAQAAARNEPMTGGGGGQPNPAYMSIKSMQSDRAATVAGLVQRRAQLQNDLSNLQSKLQSDPDGAAKQAQADRDYQVQQDQYNQLLKARADLTLRGQVQSQASPIKFTVIDPPTQPRVPTSPNRPLLLTGVLIVGLGAGVAAAFALSQLKTTFPTPQRLEKAAGMPVIGSIGEVVTAIQISERRKRFKLFAGGVGALGFAWAALLGVEFVLRGMIA